MLEVRVYDSGDENDPGRYTVVYQPGLCLEIGDNLDSSFTVCTEGPHLGREILFQELPRQVHRRALRRLVAGEPGGLFEDIAELLEWCQSVSHPDV